VKSRKFNLFLDPAAARDLKRLKRSDPEFFTKVTQVIESLSWTPFQGKQLKGKLRKIYSLRVGHYRVIYNIYASEQSVNIVRVGDRKDIYRF